MTTISGNINHQVVLQTPTYGNPILLTGSILDPTANQAALFGSGIAWTITNQGVIENTSPAGTGIQLTNGGNLTNSGTGLIQGSVDGADGFTNVTNYGTIVGGNGSGVQSGSGGTLTNAANALISGGYRGVGSSATGVSNSGVIRAAQTNGTGLILYTANSVVTNAATIAGGYVGLFFRNAGTVINTGTITGTTGRGVYINSGGYISNAAGKLISGANTGAIISSGSGTVMNAGTIVATGINSIGVNLRAGGNTTNANTGLIQATSDGADGATNLSNYGTIIGTGRYGAQYGGTGGVWLNAANAVISGVGGIHSAATLVTNAGLIQAAGTHGTGAHLYGTTGTVVNSATIVAGYDGVRFDHAGTVINTGNIIGTAHDGIFIATVGYVSNAAGKSITGAVFGAEIFGSSTLFNAGTIAATGPSGAGAILRAGGTVTNAANALIQGNAGVVLYGTGSALTNFGTISGRNGTAVAFGSAGTVVIEPGAVFNGVLGGLAKGDLIDFAHVVATGFTFAGGAVTLFNKGAVVPGAVIAVTGSFTGADLALVSDGAGGVDVGIAPLGPGIAGTYYTPILLSNPAINNSATVTATGRVAPSYGDAIIGGAGVPGTVSNLGTIIAASPSSVGISLGDGGLVANGTVGFAGGYISGSLAGVKIGGGSATITNSGTIRGGSGILIAAGSSATVSNSGRIAGTSGTAVSLAGGSNRLILAPGASFQGKADGGGGKSVVEVAPSLVGLGAAETAAAAIYVSLGSVSNFSALQVDPGAAADAAGNLSFDTLVNQGQINLLAGDALVVGTVAGAASGGTIDLKSGGSVHFTGAVAADQTVLFRPPGGTVLLDHPDEFAGALSQFAAIDLIDLPLGTASFQQYAGGMLSLNYNGAPVSLQLATTAVTPQFQFTSDGHGGTAISVSDTAACFCRGTRVLTAQGEVAVEDLRVGDRVVTLAGELKPIRWIGMGRDLVTRANKLARPIIVQQGALSDGVPHRDLHLTHGHALYLDSVLIPVEHLVNHRTIRWDERAQVVEYYHIELDDHDVVLAEGAPAESYHDAGNRAAFQNARPGSTTAQGKPTFAPVLQGGEVVEAVWARLSARAGGPAAGEVTADPDLHLVIDGQRLDPEFSEGGVYRFAVPRPPTTSLLLRSLAGVPSLLGQGRSDHRPLGVAITQLVLEQAGIATYLDYDAPQLREGGCYLHEDGFAWTDGDFMLPARFPPLARPFALLVHTQPHADMRYPLTAAIARAA